MKIEIAPDKVIELVEGDITREETDAIVNAANSSLMGGGGVDGAIHRAGGPAILEECKRIRRLQFPEGLPPGQAVATAGGNLAARYVIHTVGPIYNDGRHGEPELLASCYRECLRVADELSLESLAFPSISTGAYGYPMHEAAQIAVRTVRDALQSTAHLKRVRLVLFGESAYRTHERALQQM